MLNALLLLVLPTAAAPHVMPVVTKDPPVRVWFNSSGDYDYGDRAKVYAKSAQDAYLIVLRSDGGGALPTARRPVYGPERVLILLSGLTRRYAGVRLKPIRLASWL